MSYLTAIKQVTARASGLPLDEMMLQTDVLNTRNPDEFTEFAPVGAYINGFFLEGAGWEMGRGEEQGYLAEMILKELHPELPIMYVTAVQRGFCCVNKCSYLQTLLDTMPKYILIQCSRKRSSYLVVLLISPYVHILLQSSFLSCLSSFFSSFFSSFLALCLAACLLCTTAGATDSALSSSLLSL